MHDSAPPVQVGEVLAGKYRVEQVLGVGGMGIVVAARHIQLDQRVALKFMLPHVLGNSEAVARFLREARSAVRLTSQHIAKILDVGTLDTGAPYIVMEYLEGMDLSQNIAQKGRLTATQISDILLQACDAIAEAHSLGIIHRDLKPPNLYLARAAGGATVVKVLDFGISKAITGADANMTKTSSILGSPAYMSPEQMRSSKAVDARADIWSLGVILYEAVSGRLPFTSETFTELCIKILMEPVPRPPGAETFPPGFEAVIMRCLDKEPARRYSDVGQLAMALAPFASPSARPLAEKVRGILGGTVGGAATQMAMTAHPQVPLGTQPTQSTTTLTGAAGQEMPRPRGRRSKLPLVIGATVVLLGGGVAVALAMGGGGRSSKAPAAASAAAQPAPAATAPTPIEDKPSLAAAVPAAAAPEPEPVKAAAPDAAPPPDAAPRPAAAPPPQPTPAAATPPVAVDKPASKKPRRAKEKDPEYDDSEAGPSLVLPERTVKEPAN